MPRRIAGYGLPRRNGEAPPLNISAEAWPGVLGVLCSQRVTGLAVAAWEAGWLMLTDAQS
jgi:hypothetical protein